MSFVSGSEGGRLPFVAENAVFENVEAMARSCAPLPHAASVGVSVVPFADVSAAARAMANLYVGEVSPKPRAKARQTFSPYGGVNRRAAVVVAGGWRQAVAA